MLATLPPPHAKKIHAWQIMTENPLFIEGVISVSRIAEVLECDGNMFPVLNMAGNVMGIIPKNFLVVLVERHHWYDAPEGADVT